MRDDLTYARALQREIDRRDARAVAILFAIVFAVGIALMLAGCATAQPPANDYLPVRYSQIQAESGHRQ